MVARKDRFCQRFRCVAELHLDLSFHANAKDDIPHYPMSAICLPWGGDRSTLSHAQIAIGHKPIAIVLDRTMGSARLVCRNRSRLCMGNAFSGRKDRSSDP